jgi:hypothetical protein
MLEKRNDSYSNPSPGSGFTGSARQSTRCKRDSNHAEEECKQAHGLLKKLNRLLWWNRASQPALNRNPAAGITKNIFFFTDPFYICPGMNATNIFFPAFYYFYFRQKPGML